MSNINPFSRDSWKKAAWKVVREPEKASPGWLIAGVIIILAILKTIFSK
jgi:hypothetical protein